MVGLPGLSVPLGGVGAFGAICGAADKAACVAADVFCVTTVWFDAVDLFFTAGVAARLKIASEILETQSSPPSRLRLVINADMDEEVFFMN